MRSLIIAIALVVVAQAVHVDLSGTELRSPSGHVYHLEHEVDYSPRLRAAATAADAAADAEGDALIQTNERAERIRRVNRVQKPTDWEREQQIGKGGFGTIYQAHKKAGATGSNPNEKVAVKVVSLDGDPNVKKEFEVHMHLLQLCPQYIVRAFESWEEHGQFVMVMELMGGDFAQYYTKHAEKLTGNPNELVNQYWKQMIAGLSCLHTHGYVHRDLKGGNMLVSPDGVHLKISDFGETRTEAQCATHEGQKLLPHQTYLYTAPSALNPAVLATGANPAPSNVNPLIAPKERTFARRKTWDAYALGVTMLESYFGHNLYYLSVHSEWAPLQMDGFKLPVAKFMSIALSTPENWIGMLNKLHLNYKTPMLPQDLLQVVSDLLLGQRSPVQIDLTAHPFAATQWTFNTDTNAWVSSTRASQTAIPASQLPHHASIQIPASSHHRRTSSQKSTAHHTQSPQQPVSSHSAPASQIHTAYHMPSEQEMLDAAAIDDGPNDDH